MPKRVSISGPIQGIETNQSYRDRLSELLSKYGYVPIDPWLREKVLYRGPVEQWWNKIPPIELNPSPWITNHTKILMSTMHEFEQLLKEGL